MKFAVSLVMAGLLLWITARLAIWRFSPPAQNLMINGRLQDCPATPNCYKVSVPLAAQRARDDSSSDASAIDSDSLPAPFDQLVSTAAALPGARPIRKTDRYAHFTFTTRLMGYRDDLECLLDTNVLHCRSASRIGRSDLGANEKRVKQLLRIAGLTLDPDNT